MLAKSQIFIHLVNKKGNKRKEHLKLCQYGQQFLTFHPCSQCNKTTILKPPFCWLNEFMTSTSKVVTEAMVMLKKQDTFSRINKWIKLYQSMFYVTRMWNLKCEKTRPIFCLDIPVGIPQQDNKHSCGDSGNGLCSHSPILLPTCFWKGETNNLTVNEKKKVSASSRHLQQ